MKWILLMLFITANVWLSEIVTPRSGLLILLSWVVALEFTVFRKRNI